MIELLAPPGSGKTTILKALRALAPETAGPSDADVPDHPILAPGWSDADRRRAKLDRRCRLTLRYAGEPLTYEALLWQAGLTLAVLSLTRSGLANLGALRRYFYEIPALTTVATIEMPRDELERRNRRRGGKRDRSSIIEPMREATGLALKIAELRRVPVIWLDGTRSPADNAAQLRRHLT